MKSKGHIIRALESGTTAALRDSDIRFAGREVDRIIAENPKDQPADVPVGTLIAWREHVRRELLAELDEAGRLLPVGEVARARAAVDVLAPLAEELDLTIGEVVEEIRFGRFQKGQAA